MKLEYKVLWVDDRMDSAHVKEAQTLIETKNDSVGIKTCFSCVDAKAIIGSSETPTEFNDRVTKDFKGKTKDLSSLDLILIDLNLANEKNDDSLSVALVDEIRTKTIHRPFVIYYTGIPQNKEPIKQLSDALEAKDIWGKSVMLSSRDALKETISQILEEMHDEEHKVNNVRGLLMDQTSEIDAHFSEIAEKIWDKLPEETKEGVLKTCENDAKSKKRMKKIEKKGFKQLSLYNKSKAMVDMLKSISKYPDYSQKIEKMSSKEDSLIRIRNEYAHSTAKRLEEGFCAEKREQSSNSASAKRVEDEHCKRIREECRDLVKEGERILRELCSQQSPE